ncbi:MAG: hypothetical protein DHS20C10_04140 [marine bacterium B5-7]|nr:MAG: hypothetical protein DHS20C10_04140 [marine bacterium B5-7]
MIQDPNFRIPVGEISQLRQQLFSVQQCYETFYENSPDMYASLDVTSGAVIHCNQTLLQITGYTLEEIVGHSFLKLYDYTSVPKAKHDFDYFSRTGTIPPNAERKIKCKDGRLIDVGLKVTAVRNELGNIVASHSVWRDITSYKKMEVELRQAYIQLEEKVFERTQELQFRENLFRTLFESIPHIVWLADARGYVNYLNKAWTDVTGLPRETSLGRNWTDSIHPDDLPILLDKYNDSNMHLTIAGEARIRAKDGSYRTMSFIETPIFNSRGTPTRRVGINTDITEIKSSEKRLREHQTEKLRQSHEATLALAAQKASVGEVSSWIAHELNQPLTVISTYVQMCRERLQTPNPALPELLHAIQKVEAQSTRAGEILHAIREWYAHGEINRQLVNLNQRIYSLINLMSNKLNTLHDLQYDLSPDVPRANIDSIQIEQVMANIIRNAIDAMIAQKIDKPSIKITSRLQDSQIVITISNTGPTLKPEIIHQIFAPMYSTKKKGMGLGLSVSRTIIDAHHGELTAFNDETHTHFQFTLPLGS